MEFICANPKDPVVLATWLVLAMQTHISRVSRFPRAQVVVTVPFIL